MAEFTELQLHREEAKKNMRGGRHEKGGECHMVYIPSLSSTEHLAGHLCLTYPAERQQIPQGIDVFRQEVPPGRGQG